MAEEDESAPGEKPNVPAPAPTPEPTAEASHRPKNRPIVDFFFGTGTRIGVTVTIATSLVGTAIAIVLAENSSPTVHEIVPGTPASLAAPPRSIESPSDLQQYVLSNPIWQTKPTIFSNSLNLAFNQQGDQGGHAVAAVHSGSAVAYSVSQVTSEGASLTGEPIYVVGRVASDVASPVNTSLWNAEAEVDIVLRGPKGPEHAYALSGSSISKVHDGDVVYFRAVVAAIGTTTGNRPTTYLIGLDDPDVTSNATGSGDTVPSLAKQFGPSAAPSGG